MGLGDLGLIIALLMGVWAGAQVPSDRAIAMDTTFDLPSAVVVGRLDEAAATLPYRTEIIDGQALRQVQSLTTADALANLSGVYVQKSQLGGGSPVIRGFEANRVLLVVDGGTHEQCDLPQRSPAKCYYR